MDFEILVSSVLFFFALHHKHDRLPNHITEAKLAAKNTKYLDKPLKSTSPKYQKPLNHPRKGRRDLLPPASPQFLTSHQEPFPWRDTQVEAHLLTSPLSDSTSLFVPHSPLLLIPSP